MDDELKNRCKSTDSIVRRIALNDVLGIVYILEAQIKGIESELEKAKKILQPDQQYVYEQRREKEFAEIGKLKSTVAKKKGENTGYGKLLTVNQVAEILTVSPATVKSYIKTGKLSGIKLPGSNGEYRFKLEHLDGWLNKRTLKATSF
jgi:excisionase family DNA binding protein